MICNFPKMEWNFTLDSVIESIATVLALICLYFTIKQKVYLWIFGIASSALLMFVLGKSKIYANMLLQLYYVIISVYGWIAWSKKKDDKNQILRITLTSFRVWLILGFVFGIIFASTYYILRFYTDTDVPILDSFTTALSIIATYMLARKHLEHWILWIVVDAISLCLYGYKERYQLFFLFMVYTISAFYGYFSWRKQYQKQVTLIT